MSAGKEQIMKKTILALILTFVLAVLCGCSSALPWDNRGGSTDKPDETIVPEGMKMYSNSDIYLFNPENYTSTENSYEKDGAVMLFTGMVPNGSNDTFAVARTDGMAYDISAAAQDAVIAQVCELFPFAFEESAENMVINSKSFEKKEDRIVCSFNVTAMFGELDSFGEKKLMIPVNVDYTYVIFPIGEKTYYCSFMCCLDNGSEGIEAEFGHVIESITAAA